MIRKKIEKIVSAIIMLALAGLFVVKFGGPAILKAYIQAGTGSCEQVPILCMAPYSKIASPPITQEYLSQLRPYEFKSVKIFVPLGFSVVQRTVKKYYYKKSFEKSSKAIVYVLQRDPYFFSNLFPQLKNKGITNNYQFVKRVMYARLNRIETIPDAFFVIMKGVFTPDLGPEKSVAVNEFVVGDKHGFISYNQGKGSNYFNCDVFDASDNYFKLYIKDMEKKLDLQKVLWIISTLNSLTRESN